MTPVSVETVPLGDVNIAEIRRYARCPDGADSEIAQCIDELSSVSGKICYCECNVSFSADGLDLEFAKTTSKALARTLSGCDRIIVFATTIGILPDRLIAKYNRVSPSKALFIQAVGAERTESACDEFCKRLQKEYAAKGLTLTERFSPGYGDLPLGLQKNIFELLNPAKQIGVTLTESLLMMPTKSVTAIIGIKNNKQESAS